MKWISIRVESWNRLARAGALVAMALWALLACADQSVRPSPRTGANTTMRTASLSLTARLKVHGDILAPDRLIAVEAAQGTGLLFGVSARGRCVAWSIANHSLAASFSTDTQIEGKAGDPATSSVRGW